MVETQSNNTIQIHNNDHCKRIVLQDYTSFSESMIWDLMMQFYDRKGVSSWSEGIVPHFVSSNAFIGRSYAKIISGFLMDLERQLQMGEYDAIHNDKPFYIVELGGGSGKLAFYILKSLEALKDVINFPFENIVYVLTDFTESNIKFWEEHEALQVFVESGRLDFAKFEAVNDTDLHLLKSGKVLRVGEVKNPICLVANYVIDTLCNDAFQIDEKGELKQGFVSTGVKKSPSMIRFNENLTVDLNDIDIIKNLCNEYKYKMIDICQYSYHSNVVPKEDSVHFSRILTWYKHYFKDSEGASVLIPTGFLKALRHISDLSNGKALIITGDKGNTNPDYFSGITDPHIAIHGSFSLMVNFHAINYYIRSRGGYSLIGNQEETALQVHCFILDNLSNIDVGEQSFNDISDDKNKRESERTLNFPMTTQLFEETINNVSPHDFFVIQKCLKEEANPGLASIVSLLRLSNWDPDIFYKFRDDILDALPSAGSKLRRDLATCIFKLWNHYYHLGSDINCKDIVFELGRLAYGLSMFEIALKCYEMSLRLYGDHHITYHNAGLCHYSLFNFEEAKVKFIRALEINSHYEKSKSWLERVQSKLKSSQQPGEVYVI